MSERAARAHEPERAGPGARCRSTRRSTMPSTTVELRAGDYVEVPFGPRQVIGVVWDAAPTGGSPASA